jgi:RNA polymerase sigma-70 factor, ECF subfamily
VLKTLSTLENEDTLVGRHNLNDEAVGRLIEQEYGGLVALLHRKLRDDGLVALVLSQAIATTSDDIRSGRIADPANAAGHVFRRVLNELRGHGKPDTLTGQALDRLLSHRAQPVTVAEIDMQGEVRRILLGIFKPKDREIVKRFYLEEEQKDAICRDLGLLPLRFDKALMRVRQHMRALLARSPRANPRVST